MRSSILLFFLSVLFLSTGCRQEGLGDRLFEITYPVTDFAVPAGRPNFQTLVISQDRLTTGFVEEMMRTSTATEDIDAVGGLRARVVSLNGEDFSEIERIELRACPVGQANGCSQFDLLFSVDDLFRRRQQTVNLNPGLRNFRELFLGNEQVRVELVLSPGITTSRNIEARLEWAIQAVGNLD